MKIKSKYFLQILLSISVVVITGKAVKAEDTTFKNACTIQSSKCDALIYASKIYSPTYGISSNSEDKDKAIQRLKDIGWQDIKPIDVQGGMLDGIDSHAVLSKKDVNGKTYYLISFRGTASPTNLKTDASGFPVESVNGGQVHKGFYDYTQAIYNSPEFRAMLDEIFAKQSSGKPFEILITGHSLGGAAAQMMAYFLKAGNGMSSDNINTIVFGSPAVGSKDFSDRYLKDVTRIEMQLDPVSELRNPLFTEVEYGKKISLSISKESRNKLILLIDEYNKIPSWNIKRQFEISAEIWNYRFTVIHMEYDKEIDRLYEEWRLARIRENQPSISINYINSCYTSQNSSHITSAACYISRPPEESLYFPDPAKSLPLTTEKRSEYTDGTIVRAPIDIGLTWNQATNLDLDSHTVTPNGDHVYFSERGSLTQAPFTFLYRDSIPASGIKGAEQTRITQFQDGTYRFYIYNFSDQQNLAPAGLSDSTAKVQIFQGGAPLTDIPNDPNTFDLNNPGLQKVGEPYPGQNTFNIPTGQSGNTWYVFKLDTRTGILNRVDRFGNINGSSNVPTFK